MITITTTFGPQIIQCFDKKLLTVNHRLQDDADLLLKIGEGLLKKINSAEYIFFPETVRKLKEQYQKFMVLYEQSKAKEKQNESSNQKEIKTKEFWYRIKLPNRSNNTIFNRLRNKSLYSRD